MIIILAILLVSGFTYLSTRDEDEITSTQENPDSQKSNLSIDTSDWNTYTDKVSGVTMKYPRDWTKTDCSEYDSDKINCFLINKTSEIKEDRLDNGIKFYTSPLSLPSLLAWDYDTISLARGSTDDGLTYIIRKINSADPSGYIDVYYIPRDVSEINSIEQAEKAYKTNKGAQIIALSSQEMAIHPEERSSLEIRNSIIMTILKSVNYK